MEDKLELSVIGLSASISNPAFFVLMLEARETQQELPVIIGEAEAQSIAIALEDLRPPQPLSHDLMVSLLSASGMKLREVLIYEMEGQLFRTQLHGLDHANREVIIPCRCSDAVALAVRAGTPIFTYESILSLASVELPWQPARVKRGSLRAYSLSELEAILENLLVKEDYKSAARIRDMISKRKKDSE